MSTFFSDNIVFLYMGIIAVGLVFLWFLLREIICWYFKINKIILLLWKMAEKMGVDMEEVKEWKPLPRTKPKKQPTPE